MSPDSEHLTPGRVFGRRVRETRKRRGWTQADLVKRLNELGWDGSRTTIAKIEQGGIEGKSNTRAELASLRDLFAFAAALGVAPVHLLVPLEDEAIVDIARNRPVVAPLARKWIRGLALLDDADVRAYLNELPEEELRDAVERGLAQGMDTLTLALGLPRKIQKEKNDA